jgi:galactose mutarotase-like enzyme
MCHKTRGAAQLLQAHRRNTASARRPGGHGAHPRTRVEGYKRDPPAIGPAHLDATFVPIAGTVGASLRDGGDELLGRGLGVHRYARGGTTMGIPLLRPWVNRLAGDEYRVNATTVRLAPDARAVARDEQPMTAPTNALGSGDRLPLVAPGGGYRAVFSITVTR